MTVLRAAARAPRPAVDTFRALPVAAAIGKSRKVCDER